MCLPSINSCAFVYAGYRKVSLAPSFVVIFHEAVDTTRHIVTRQKVTGTGKVTVSTVCVFIFQLSRHKGPVCLEVCPPWSNLFLCVLFVFPFVTNLLFSCPFS